MTNETKLRLSFKEALRYMNKRYMKMSDTRLRELVANEEITHYRPGGKLIYFKPEDLEKWYESQKVEAKSIAQPQA